MQSTIKVYEGQPFDILSKLGDDICQALHAAGINPTGLHLLALIHLIASNWRAEDRTFGSGQVPSFQMLLRCFVHSMLRENWTEQESMEFVEEFKQIVQSLGGNVAPAGQQLQPLFMAPASDIVH